MAIAVERNKPKIATLATTRKVLQFAGADVDGDILEIAWVAQTATNIVLVELGSGLTDGGAVGTDRIPVSPGSGYRAYVPIAGQGGVAVAGSGAFDVSLRIIRL